MCSKLCGLLLFFEAIMNEDSCNNQESGNLQTVVRDDDQRLLPLTPTPTPTPTPQIWQNASPLSYSFGDSPTSPGTYYTTIQSTCSRRYENATKTLIRNYLKFNEFTFHMKQVLIILFKGEI